jgi:hypothetical protein
MSADYTRWASIIRNVLLEASLAAEDERLSPQQRTFLRLEGCRVLDKIADAMAAALARGGVAPEVAKHSALCFVQGCAKHYATA